MKIKSKQVGVFLFIFIQFCIISLGIAFLRGGYIEIGGLTGFSLSSLIGFLVYTCLTPIYLKNYRKRLSLGFILLAIWLGVGLFETIVRIFDFRSGLVSLPSTLLWWMGIVCGYLYWKVTKIWQKIMVVFIPFVFCVWMSYCGYSFWLHKLNHGTFTGMVSVKLPLDYALFDDPKEHEVYLSQFKGKYLLLDFWTKRCGSCYKKMPLIEELYAHFKDRNDISIFGVFVCQEEEDIQEGREILKNKGYSFPTLSTYFSNMFLETVPVTVYPTVLVFDPDGMLIYLGNTEGAIRLVKDRTELSFQNDKQCYISFYLERLIKQLNKII